jgi:predicted DNA-binding transcriptional regulator AlpA
MPQITSSTLFKLTEGRDSGIRLLRMRDLIKRVGIAKSRATIYEWIKKYGFPPGRMIGPTTRVWTEEEVAAWFATRPIESNLPNPNPKRKDGAIKTKVVKAKQAKRSRQSHA